MILGGRGLLVFLIFAKKPGSNRRALTRNNAKSDTQIRNLTGQVDVRLTLCSNAQIAI